MEEKIKQKEGITKKWRTGTERPKQGKKEGKRERKKRKQTNKGEKMILSDNTPVTKQV